MGSPYITPNFVHELLKSHLMFDAGKIIEKIINKINEKKNPWQKNYQIKL